MIGESSGCSFMLRLTVWVCGVAEGGSRCCSFLPPALLFASDHEFIQLKGFFFPAEPAGLSWLTVQ